MLTDWQIKLINRTLGELKRLPPSEMTEEIKQQIKELEDKLNDKQN